MSPAGDRSMIAIGLWPLVPMAAAVDLGLGLFAVRRSR